MDFTIRKASAKDLPDAASMAACIWHSASAEELEADFAGLVQSREAAVFLAFSGSTLCGFAQCGLRHDYVEGTHSSPVGYLEGIFVKPEFRKLGCAGTLLSACESWSKALGCKEFASDCELTNGESLNFHLKLGFREVNRIICFTKTL